MILNVFEETKVKNEKLPPEWRSQHALDELEEFLQHNWDQRSVFYDDFSYDTKQQFLGFLSHNDIRTKNYIGTIAFRGEQLNIFPKVFREDSEDRDTSELDQKHLMKNLVHWLDYCNRVAYPFINISAELSDAEDLRELFITLYVGYVRAALERGLFYRYVEETRDLGTIKGKFDFKDYIFRKIPNGQSDKFNCTYSTFEFDNWINRIIKYTCKELYNSTSKRNQRIIRNILVKMNEVSDVSCTPGDCDRVRLSKMHSNYRMIINMSKMFLLNKTTGLSVDTNDAFCFLFPTELLFEGFIGGFMQEVVEGCGGKVSLQKYSRHIIKDIQYAGRSLGSAFATILDILVEVNGKSFILDTKYKEVSRFEGDDEAVYRTVTNEPSGPDVYQVCEYARIHGVKEVFLLYPMFRYEDPEPDIPQGQSGDITIHFVRLPFIFESDSERTRKQLTTVIKGLFDLQDD